MNRTSSTLIEFSFTSRLSSGLPVAALARLVRQAWHHTMKAGVTGEMELRGDGVRQVLEGDVEAVLPLVSRILSDPRHTGIEVVAFGPIAARRHQGWRVHGLSVEPAERPDLGEALVVLHPAEPKGVRGTATRVRRAGQG